MRIAGLQKLTLLDYPGLTACTVFTPGCNWRCPFCHNTGLVLCPNEWQIISESEFFSFLLKRHQVIDAVCISGGEPLLQLDIKPFVKRIKKLGFKCKIDTNGSFPEALKELVNEGLVDYVAMDLKNVPELYSVTTGLKNADFSSVKASFDFLNTARSEGKIYLEFRTTVLKTFHNMEILAKLAELSKGADIFSLQRFRDNGNLLCSSDKNAPVLTAFSEEEIQKIFSEVVKINKKATLRG